MLLEEIDLFLIIETPWSRFAAQSQFGLKWVAILQHGETCLLQCEVMNLCSTENTMKSMIYYFWESWYSCYMGSQ